MAYTFDECVISEKELIFTWEKVLSTEESCRCVPVWQFTSKGLDFLQSFVYEHD